jgi:hypothetical protein
MAALLIIHNLVGFLFLGDINSIGPRASIAATTILGTFLTAAAAIYAIERYETRRSHADVSAYVCHDTVAALFGLPYVGLPFLFMSPDNIVAVCGVGTLVHR